MRTPLTPEEHARLRALLGARFLRRTAADDRLIDMGLVHEGNLGWVIARREQIGPDGSEPYYERSTGEVNPVSYPTIGEEDVLRPGCFFAVTPQGGVTVVSVPEKEPA